MSRRVLSGVIGPHVEAAVWSGLLEEIAVRHDVRALCQPMDVTSRRTGAESVGDLVSAAGTCGFAGVAILPPCQQTVVKYLYDLTPVAAALGEVDTVVFDGELAIGHHAVPAAFGQAFQRALPAAVLDRVVLLGAGGTAAPVAYALVCLGVRNLAVVDPVVERSELLADLIEHAAPAVGAAVTVHATHDLDEALDEVGGLDGLVSVTPEGGALLGRASVLARRHGPRPWVVDLGNPGGPVDLPGGQVVVAQVAESFRLVTGIVPDQAYVRDLCAARGDRDRVGL